MTTPPLPADPTLRIKLDYNDSANNLMGSRFYLTYAGSAPTGANCIAIADAIEAAWVANLAPIVNAEFALAEVDVLDIATYTGLSGQWTGNQNGTESGALIPASVATNVEFGISRRYRGGKPRMFIPPPGQDKLQNGANWTAAFLTSATTAVEGFFTACEAISVGAVGTLQHVNLSYYQGFTNHTSTSGRERAVPTYRTTALVDKITGYFVKATVGSQRRRRTSTTY